MGHGLWARLAFLGVVGDVLGAERRRRWRSASWLALRRCSWCWGWRLVAADGRLGVVSAGGSRDQDRDGPDVRCVARSRAPRGVRDRASGRRRGSACVRWRCGAAMATGADDAGRSGGSVPRLPSLRSGLAGDWWAPVVRSRSGPGPAGAARMGRHAMDQLLLGAPGCVAFVPPGEVAWMALSPSAWLLLFIAALRVVGQARLGLRFQRWAIGAGAGAVGLMAVFWPGRGPGC